MTPLFILLAGFGVFLVGIVIGLGIGHRHGRESALATVHARAEFEKLFAAHLEAHRASLVEDPELSRALDGDSVPFGHQQ